MFVTLLSDTMMLYGLGLPKLMGLPENIIYETFIIPNMLGGPLRSISSTFYAHIFSTYMKLEKSCQKDFRTKKTRL